MLTKNTSLKHLTYYKTGGKCAYLYSPTNTLEVQRALSEKGKTKAGIKKYELP